MPPTTERSVPEWALASATLAPIALIGGWTLGARRQPAGFDQTRDTISALAAHGAADRWIMTTGLAVLGVCHLVTAAGLRPGRAAGRVLLATGGLATLAVAALPQPEHGSAPAHIAAATVGFVTLAGWPVAAARPGCGLLRPLPSALASATMLGLLGWLLVELRGGDRVGLAERLVAGSEALWPLAVALTRTRFAAGRPVPRR